MTKLGFDECMMVVVVFAMLGMPVVMMSVKHHNVTTATRAALFNEGDTVSMRTFGHVGQIVRRDCNRTCTYDVRFSALQSSTKHRVLGSGGNIDVAPVSLVRGVREYELELTK